MVFRRRLPSIQSRKHEVTWVNLAQDASTVQRIPLAVGTQAADVTDATATECQTGCTVSSIFLEFHFAAETVTNPKVINWTVEKEPFGQALSGPNILQGATRRFVFKRGMEMLPKDVATVFKRIIVVRIPPRFRRLGIGDQLTFSYIASSTQTINACGIAVYKAFND